MFVKLIIYSYWFHTTFLSLCLVLILISSTHYLIREKINEIIEKTFSREASVYLACNEKRVFYLRRPGETQV